jgi:hypothetical protein
MKTRREFLATTMAAASMINNSSQTAAPPGLSAVDETVDEIERKDTVPNHAVPGG